MLFIDKCLKPQIDKTDYRDEYYAYAMEAAVADYEYQRCEYEAEMLAIEAYHEYNGNTTICEAQNQIIMEGFLSNVWEKLKEWFKKAWEAVKSFFKWIKKNIKKAWEWLKKKWKSLTESYAGFDILQESSDNTFTLSFDIQKLMDNIKKVTKSGPSGNEAKDILIKIIKDSESSEEVSNRLSELLLVHVVPGYKVNNMNDMANAVKELITKDIEKDVTYTESELDKVYKKAVDTLTDLEDELEDCERYFNNFEKEFEFFAKKVKKEAGNELNDKQISLFVKGSKLTLEYGMTMLRACAYELNVNFMRMVKSLSRQSRGK